MREHWHSANATHTMILGTAILECDGQRAEIGPGGFNFMPARMCTEVRRGHRARDPAEQASSSRAAAAVGWALYGLAEVYRRLGRDEETPHIAQRLAKALAGEQHVLDLRRL